MEPNYQLLFLTALAVLGTAWGSPFQKKSDKSTEEQIMCGTTVVAPNMTSAASEDKFQARIVGGYEATNHSWPWQAMFVHKRPGQAGFYFHCGASIVGDRWILTAAHCCTPQAYNNLFVVVGDHDMTSIAEPHQFDTDMEAVYVHPRYQIPTQLNNDFCLMKTKKALTFSDHVRPICLPSSSDAPPPVGTTCYTSGWGSTSENVQMPVYPPILRQADMRIMDQTLCSLFYGPLITSSMICASIPGQGSCLGDSGGPLMCQNDETGQWILTGVTSFVSSAGCGHSIYPTVYARPAAVLDWIAEIMESH